MVDQTDVLADDDPDDSYTVIGLFESTLDAEEALIALRRAARPPEQVSVLIRDWDAETHQRAGSSAVARSVVENALDAVGGWLVGLAALIIPDHGTYLVAGPIGAALAGMSHAQTLTDPEGRAVALSQTRDEPVDDEVLQILIEFGFGRDEAGYIEHRLNAGDSVVAVTSSDPGQLGATRRLFADDNAVHIGQARTRVRIAKEALILLGSPVTAVDGVDVVVTDAVAPLRGLCQEAEADREPWVEHTCGGPVVDRDGDEVGTIDEVLADAVLDGDREDRRREVRYVVIGYGGVLGLGRRRIAVPANVIDLGPAPARLAMPKDLFQRAPSYEPEAPFSRREEQAIFAYFGTSPYWASAELFGQVDAEA